MSPKTLSVKTNVIKNNKDHRDSKDLTESEIDESDIDDQSDFGSEPDLTQVLETFLLMEKNGKNIPEILYEVRKSIDTHNSIQKEILNTLNELKQAAKTNNKLTNDMLKMKDPTYT